MNQIMLFQDSCSYVSARIIQGGLVLYSEVKDEKMGYHSEMEVVVDPENFKLLLMSEDFLYTKPVVEENFEEILIILKKKIQTASGLIKLLDKHVLKYVEKTVY